MRNAIGNDVRLGRIRPEDRELLEHEAQVRVGRGQRQHVFLGAFAVAAIVIVELDDRGLAVRVADIAVIGGVEDVVLGSLDHFEVGDPLLFALLGLQRLLHIEQEFRVLHQIIADDVLDFDAVRRAIRRGESHRLAPRVVGDRNLRTAGEIAYRKHPHCNGDARRAQPNRLAHRRWSSIR